MRELRRNPDFRGVDKKSEKREIGKSEKQKSEKQRQNEGKREKQRDDSPQRHGDTETKPQNGKTAKRKQSQKRNRIEGGGCNIGSNDDQSEGKTGVGGPC
jgi:hypothetical protein